MILRYWTPKEIAAEAREALSRAPQRTPEEVWARLLDLGWINARGQVTKLLGGDADPEVPLQNPTKMAPDAEEPA